MTKKQQTEVPGIVRAVEIATSQAALAAQLGSRYPHKKHCSQQAVSQWVRQGFVPLERAAEVSEVTGVPACDLVRPDVRALFVG